MLWILAAIVSIYAVVRTIVSDELDELQRVDRQRDVILDAEEEIARCEELLAHPHGEKRLVGASGRAAGLVSGSVWSVGTGIQTDGLPVPPLGTIKSGSAQRTIR